MLLRSRRGVPARFKPIPAALIVLVVVGAFMWMLNGNWFRFPEVMRDPLDPGLVNSFQSHQCKDGHRLCVLVPFRDRFEELFTFVPRITQFLAEQGLCTNIYIVNQVDEFRFNRASLLNAGFLESQKNTEDVCDFVALHDVDLIPKTQKLVYEYPESGPLHLSPPGLHPKYSYSTFLGGILLVNVKHFLKLNGLSNRYWGWGLEDDEFRARIKDSGLPIERPDLSAIGTGQDTFDHYHVQRMRKRDMVKCHNQWEETRLRDRVTGVNSVEYEVKRRREMSIDGSPFTFLDVALHCDKARTPWCDCSGVQPDIQPWKRKNLGNTDDVIVPVLRRKTKH